MIHGAFALSLATIVAGSPSAFDGVIEGVVVNGSRNNQHAAGIEVVLRVQVDGQFIGVARTTSQSDGRFRFENLPVGLEGPYLPGANQDDVHFPGRRLWLSTDQRRAAAELTVYESTSDFNPLVIQNHRMDLRPEPGLLRVTESIVIENPSNYCYTGKIGDDGAEPVTLRLAIPPDFQRVTFAQEAVGRRFAVDKGSLITRMPWPPGTRELSFTYVIPNQQSYRVLERPLGLPCSRLILTVQTDDPQNVSCNVTPVTSEGQAEQRFESDAELPPGFVIRLELGRLPVPLIAYGRSAAVVILTALIVGVTLVSLRRRQRFAGSPSQAARPRQATPVPSSPTRRLRSRGARGPRAA